MGAIQQAVAAIGGVTDTPFITSQVLGTLRNDFTGSVGFKFTTLGSNPPTVTALGRWKVAGNSQTHTVYLVDLTGGGIVVASVSVDMAAGANAAYGYTNLGASLLLSVSNEYFLCSGETNGGDQWYSSDTSVSVTAAATMDGATFDPDVPPSGSVGGTPAPGLFSYVPVNFQYR